MIRESFAKLQFIAAILGRHFTGICDVQSAISILCCLFFDLLNYIIQELESEAQYRQAEQHFVDGGDWKAAVNMHRAKSMWDDAYRVSLITVG